MAERDRSDLTLRRQRQPEKAGPHNRWGRVAMDENTVREHYGAMPTPPRAGEVESPKRLVGRNRNSG